MADIFLQSFAEWAWGNNNSKDGNNPLSPEYCLESFPFGLFTTHTECLLALVVKAIGIAIILGAFLNKAPLVLKIINNSSVAGISIGAVYGETIMYANSAFYSYLRNNPFTAYGENGIVTIQTVVVALLVWKYREDPSIISFQHKVLVIIIFGIYLFVVNTMISEDYLYLLQTSNWPVLLYSRGSQIYTFYSCKHTGTQSFITTGMNLAGSCIRLLTTIQEVGYDMTLLSGYALSAVLNIILVVQFLFYVENTDKYLQSLKVKQQNQSKAKND